jgi:hypothetical protein
MPESAAPVQEHLYHDDFIRHDRRRANHGRGRHAFPTRANDHRHGLGSLAGPRSLEQRHATDAEAYNKMGSEILASSEDSVLVESEQIPGSLDRTDFATIRRWFRHVPSTSAKFSGGLQNLAGLSDRIWPRLVAINSAHLTRLPVIGPLWRIAKKRLGPVLPLGKRQEPNP